MIFIKKFSIIKCHATQDSFVFRIHGRFAHHASRRADFLLLHERMPPHGGADMVTAHSLVLAFSHLSPLLSLSSSSRLFPCWGAEGAGAARKHQKITVSGRLSKVTGHICEISQMRLPPSLLRLPPTWITMYRTICK